MNYYRRYIGDYGKATTLLSLAEHGAYALLLDHYYAYEAPLPLDMEDVFRIARAIKPEERKAVERVLAKYFTQEPDGFHNGRADAELERAQPAIEAAKRNGSKGGRPPKENPPGYETESQRDSYDENPPGLNSEPTGIAIRAGDPTTNHQPPTASHQEPTPNQNPEKRIPGDNHIGAPAARGLALAEAKIDPETPAAILSSVCVANGVSATAFNPLVVEWARDGITTERLKAAIATARMRKPTGKIPPAYLDTILRDNNTPMPAEWRQDDGKAEALARELGIKGAKAGETRESFHQRITEALHERARGKVA